MTPPKKPAKKTVAKPAPRKRAPAKKPPPKPPVVEAEAPEADEPELDLHALGARVVSVFGPFGSRVLIEMSTGLAERLFTEPLAQASRTELITAVERDIKDLEDRAPGLGIGKSALAATSTALAIEIEHPYNSATAKAQCARVLTDTLEQLRALAPPAEEKDGLDDLTERRNARLTGGRPAS